MEVGEEGNDCASVHWLTDVGVSSVDISVSDA
jgi:hypothetical protein